MTTGLLITVGLMGLFLAVINAVLLITLLSMRRKMSQVSGWPSTRGVVMTSALESRASTEGGYLNYPVVRYSYQVGAQAFQGTRIALGPEVGGPGARHVIERYPAGSPVDVYYNPSDPADALLEKSVPAQRWMWIILGIFDVALCGAIPVVWWFLSR
ncbi:MAG: DUF3592 domain-containing protein [Bacteroidota bacterium]